MGEGPIRAAKKSFQLIALALILWNGLLLLIVGSGLYFYTNIDPAFILLFLMGLLIVCSAVTATIIARMLTKPLEFLSNAILHIAPDASSVPAPDVTKLPIAKELVSTLTHQLYDFATAAHASPAGTTANEELCTDDLSIPIIGLDKNGVIRYCNAAAESLTGPKESSVGQPLTAQLDIRSTAQTLDQWIKEAAENSVQAQKVWRSVDVRSKTLDTRSYYDIATHFRNNHPSGIEVIAVLMPHDEVFETQETALALIALAVHEIRTPLTIMRGNLEALEEEVLPTLSPEMQSYLTRTITSSQSLNGFISNILGVARADQDQLSLNLREASWQTTLPAIIEMLKVRAEVRGKTIQLDIAEGLPTIALDEVSITEVLTNLIENAIKYSPDTATTIAVTAKLDNMGMVETTVTDQGYGIPDSVVPNLFNKFSRNHRNSAHITGTGLGLFLCKAIISAHHGNIWVNSKEGKGTTVGFTLLPFDRLAESNKASDNIIRTKHGWIKNHSMQRR